MDKVLEDALSSEDKDLRANALTLIPESSIEEGRAVELFKKILDEGSIIEQQSAFSVLSDYKGEQAVALLAVKMEELKEGSLAPEIQLDLLEAVGDSIATAFHASKTGESPLKSYQETLSGGNERNGRGIFFRNAEAQCVRCHSHF